MDNVKTYVNKLKSDYLDEIRDILTEVNKGDKSFDADLILDKYDQVESKYKDSHLQNCFTYIFNLSDRRITKFWGAQRIGLNPSTTITKATLDEQVLEEQKSLIKNDVFTIFICLGNMLIDSFCYSSLRALYVNGSYHYCLVTSSPFDIRNECILSYTTTITIIKPYEGEPYSSSVDFVNNSNLAYEKYRLKLKKKFIESKHKLFEQTSFEKHEALIIGMLSMGMSRTKIVQKVTNNYKKAFVNESSITYVKTKSLRAFYEKHFPESFQYSYSNDVIVKNISQIFGLNSMAL